jgi:hypothetical protein
VPAFWLNFASTLLLMYDDCRVLPHFPQRHGLVPQYGVQNFKPLDSQRLGFATCIGTFVKKVRNTFIYSVTIISYVRLECRNVLSVDRNC